MAIKGILVHVDDSSSCETRIRAAVSLASSHGAHLAGLYVMPSPFTAAYTTMPVSVDLLQKEMEALEFNAGKAKTLFGDISRQAGLRAEWRCEKGDLLSTLSVHSHYADLVVLGQDDPNESIFAPGEPTDRVVFGSGRPILLIPCIGAPEVIGSRVVVAWNAKREAVCAIKDALPLLERAKEVTVLTINPKSGPADHGQIAGADVCLYLARHGIKSEAHTARSSDMDIGDLLLSTAADKGADLIVMGAYGHSRIREIALGGTTRHVLKHMTVPVLMSH